MNMMSYPSKLQDIIKLFESLPDGEKRELLISYAEQASRYRPIDGEDYDLEDIRKDEECTDEVGVFLLVDDDGRAQFRVALGAQVQTLTKALSSILCSGLEGTPVDEVLALPADFVPKLIGAQLVRARSQTVYYVLTRLKSICKVYRDRQRRVDGQNQAANSLPATGGNN